MPKLKLTVEVHQTEAFTVLLGMKGDIQEMVDLIPDYCPEKEKLIKSMDARWRKMVDLVELVKE